MLVKRAEYFNKDLIAYVFKSNAGALEFYRKRDFEIVEETRSHYKIMHKKKEAKASFFRLTIPS